jgi:hypothetical protein
MLCRSLCAGLQALRTSARGSALARAKPIAGTFRQSRTGRLFRYSVICDQVCATEVIFACTISEPSKGMFGGLERGASVEGTVPVGPDCVPVELAIRSRVLSHIERTDFGEWKLPPPSWIGWRGPYL